MRLTRPSYKRLAPASSRASGIARRASSKRDTRPEVLLRKALRDRGLRFRTNVTSLPGCPDIVITGSKLAVFCDGDFWHGRRLTQRLARLHRGHNAEYWVAKIRSNVQHDRNVVRALRASGWTVLRFWETDLRANCERAAEKVLSAMRDKRAGLPRQSAPGSKKRQRAG